MKNDLFKHYVNGRSCNILGLGVSNLPLTHLLADWNVPLTVYDKKSPEELGEDALALRNRGVRFMSGERCFDTLSGELIFRSPGIRPDLQGIQQAVNRGAELTSEIELFLQLTDAESFAITGSDGKTTSTTLTGRFLAAEAERCGVGQVLVGGNIGSPLLDRLTTVGKTDRAVMELSSFQLMTVKRAPTYAAITNVSPNHMDWHKESMDEYLMAKKNIVGKETKRLVTNADCPTTAAVAAELLRRKRNGEKGLPEVYLFSSTRSSFSALFADGACEGDCALYEKDGWIVLSDGVSETPLLAVSDILVPGKHNKENYMTAIGLVQGSVDPSVFGAVARDFRGVEHRLELVRSLDGVDYYNSSIDSSPTRTAAALSALRGRDIVIICGGYDKKLSFAPLAEALCRSARAVVLTGATAQKIEDALLAHPSYRDGAPEICRVSEFEDAVLTAKTMAKRGGCVLLSPACASFDAFRNFAERGNTFRRIVENFEN